jgi:taurine--2-oxoglutarate transaminase
MSYPFFFTWTAQRDAQPIDIAGGEGAKFRDELGQEWLDLSSLSYQANLGHGHPKMIAAIAGQARRLCLAPPTAVFPAKVDLARALLGLAPAGFTKVFFTLSGSEANENAMKIARLVTGRFKFVSRYRSYHGASLGALSLTGDYRRPPLEPVLPGVIHVGDDAADIERVLALEGSQVAAVFLEPVPGANGVYVPPPDYFARIRAACDRHGVLLVLDEVLCGFGRTGACFGFEHFAVRPDMITCAKALTAGYAPLGAVLCHEKLSAHFDSRVLWAGLTAYAHPLGCAAGLAALKIYQSQRLFERAAALGGPFRQALLELAETCPAAGDVRSIGLLGAVDLELSRAGWDRLRRELARRHVLVHSYPRRGMIVVAPPLVIDESELRAGLARVAEALETALAG